MGIARLASRILVVRDLMNRGQFVACGYARTAFKVLVRLEFTTGRNRPYWREWLT